MPSEKIHGEAMPINVRVGWSRDMYVQVGVEHSLGASAIIEIVNGWLAAAGDPPLDWDKLRADAKDRTGAEPDFTGWHSTLDRPATNELIRVLRRARDQAYGRDE